MPILQVTLAPRVPVADFARIVADAAPHHGTIPGLRWKIWLVDAARARRVARSFAAVTSRPVGSFDPG